MQSQIPHWLCPRADFRRSGSSGFQGPLPPSHAPTFKTEAMATLFASVSGFSALLSSKVTAHPIRARADRPLPVRPSAPRQTQPGLYSKRHRRLRALAFRSGAQGATSTAHAAVSRPRGEQEPTD